ncbi:MAG: glycosyltransferase family 2 protein [Planctomycetota bacterium]
MAATVSNAGVQAPIRVEPKPAQAVSAARVAVHVVTWNRKEMCDRCLSAIAEQSHGADRLDVVVIDNGSTDGTVEWLTERWNPERTVDNPTERAHEPAFSTPREREGAVNAGGFRSLTIVANAHNHGGCGGFNTGFAFTESFHDRGESDRPDFVWLVDDDAIPHERCLEHLVRAGESHDSVGLVGSRMVDMTDHAHTLETTVYFTPSNGLLGPAPEPGHPMYEPHRHWISPLGGKAHGYGEFTGVRDVDVQAACSLLGRWDRVKEIGFWDSRYFIYNDDADWCLRFRKAGYRVLINLDAVVYHEPWHAKVTPARAYYGQRNVVWMCQKIMAPGPLRRVTARRMGRLMLGASRALVMRRVFHGKLICKTAADIMDNRGGKLAFTEPAKEDLVAAMSRSGALHTGGRVVFLVKEPYMLTHAINARDAVRSALAERGQASREPRWVFVVRNSAMPTEDFTAGDERSELIEYGSRIRSRWVRKQLPFLLKSPDLAVVFDQNNDFPLLSGGWTAHIDTRAPTVAQAERTGLKERARLAGRIAATGVRSAWFAATVKPQTHRGRFGV